MSIVEEGEEEYDEIAEDEDDEEYDDGSVTPRPLSPVAPLCLGVTVVPIESKARLPPRSSSIYSRDTKDVSNASSSRHEQRSSSVYPSSQASKRRASDITSRTSLTNTVGERGRRSFKASTMWRDLYREH